MIRKIIAQIAIDGFIEVNTMPRMDVSELRTILNEKAGFKHDEFFDTYTFSRNSHGFLFKPSIVVNNSKCMVLTRVARANFHDGSLCGRAVATKSSAHIGKFQNFSPNIRMKCTQEGTFVYKLIPKDLLNDSRMAVAIIELAADSVLDAIYGHSDAL
ncbi:MAG: hypothetical protein LBR91_02845 [Puniceicoccales bacterium]|nr:hypothetical protein [Puniceicoccales bacterium]